MEYSDVDMMMIMATKMITITFDAGRDVRCVYMQMENDDIDDVMVIMMMMLTNTITIKCGAGWDVQGVWKTMT